MRILMFLMLAAGAALMTVGAVVPELFVLALLGMLILTGAASAALAATAHHGEPPHAYY